MDGFECKLRVPHKGARPGLTIGISALVSIILEATLLHTESTSHPMAWYTNNSTGFILTNWQVEVLKYPSWNDVVTICTRPVFFRGILAERTFRVSGEDGEVIARANSGWVFTDLLRRRPVRPDLCIMGEYGEPGPPFMEKDFALPDYSDYRTVNVRRFISTRRDTDANGHVNNATYLDWGLDGVPDDVYGGLNVREMKAVYKKECLSGREVLARTLNDPKEGGRFVSIIEDAADGTLICGMYFRFE